jgi:hypothetical protein
MMSHFVFGYVQADRVPNEGRDLAVDLEAKAAIHGLHVFTNERIPQQIVLEMLAEQIGRGAGCSFLCTLGADENTSDSLISPFQCSAVQISARMVSLERWADAVLRALPVAKLSMFLTEGYDTAFSSRALPASGWAVQITQLIDDEGNVPSLRLELSG